jgi:translation initiation factor 2 subunit 2
MKMTHAEEEIDSEGLKIDFTSKKKKKKKPRINEFEQENENENDNERKTTINDDKDYTYEFLLDRLFSKLYSSNPELTQKKDKTHLKPVEVAREGTKKTVFSNFAGFCKVLNREKEHLMSFILSELCADGSIDGTERLIIRGKYPPSAIEKIVRNYITQYVLCNGCKSLDTFIDKEKATRLTYLRCNVCQASVSIKPITNGYRAKC